MKRTPHPNFEKFKQAVYDYISSLPEGHWVLLGKTFKPHHVKRQEFLNDLNTFLDRLDIRVVPAMVRELVEKKAKLPTWIKTGAYAIEYNKYDCLDLIRVAKN